MSGVSVVSAANSLSATVPTNQQRLPRYATMQKNLKRSFSAAVNALAANPCVTVLTIPFEQLWAVLRSNRCTGRNAQNRNYLNLTVDRGLVTQRFKMFSTVQQLDPPGW